MCRSKHQNGMDQLYSLVGRQRFSHRSNDSMVIDSTSQNRKERCSFLQHYYVLPLLVGTANPPVAGWSEDEPHSLGTDHGMLIGPEV